MLASFLIAASAGAGFAQAPWWFWIVGGIALATVSLTDPVKLRPAHGTPGDAGMLMLNGMLSLAMWGAASAFAFATGRMMWWSLLS